MEKMYAISGIPSLKLEDLGTIQVILKQSRVGELVISCDYETNLAFDDSKNGSTIIINGNEKAKKTTTTTSNSAKINLTHASGDGAVAIGGNVGGANINTNRSYGTGQKTVFQKGSFNLNISELHGDIGDNPDVEVQFGTNHFKTTKPTNNFKITIFVPPGTELEIVNSCVDAEDDVLIGNTTIQLVDSQLVEIKNLSGNLTANLKGAAKLVVAGTFDYVTLELSGNSIAWTNGDVDNIVLNIEKDSKVCHHGNLGENPTKTGKGQLIWV